MSKNDYTASKAVGRMFGLLAREVDYITFERLMDMCIPMDVSNRYRFRAMVKNLVAPKDGEELNEAFGDLRGHIRDGV